MTDRIDVYSREHPSGVSLKLGTSDVPADGLWHLLNGGSDVGSYKSMKPALDAYRKAIEETGWVSTTPPDRSPVDIGAIAADDAALRSAEFWSNAHQFRRRGGKGR